ncbi:hypothetical protein N7414_05060 [Pseudomonas sp. GD04087]|uniref:hypothetical protein n=1 Tax=Pseudomonas TaxID=286 RepID=UPI001F3A2671|nr:MULTISPECIES: hypothetical protein [Pseudomonas]MDH0288474.1 hypothetical protein [Pseudomonas sp. GD04087]MDH1048626.1 hypothetical protein [Pseudomonas sp. GD03903]MDH2000869.1 hypothetical protein [Pseudomonas sp. GD03691]
MHSELQSFPKQSFFFYLAQDIDEKVKDSIRDVISKLALSRGWSISPPEFVDEVDDAGEEVVGGVLEVYSALPPNKLSREADSRNLEEVEQLIFYVKELSGRESLSFEFQLGSTYVGSIEDGVIDRTLQDGLLNPWRDNLARLP